MRVFQVLLNFGTKSGDVSYGELNGDYHWFKPKQHKQNEAEDGHGTHVYWSKFHSGHDPGIHLGFSVDFCCGGGTRQSESCVVFFIFICIHIHSFHYISI